MVLAVLRELAPVRVRVRVQQALALERAQALGPVPEQALVRAEQPWQAPVPPRTFP